MSVATGQGKAEGKMVGGRGVNGLIDWVQEEGMGKDSLNQTTYMYTCNSIHMYMYMYGYTLYMYNEGKNTQCTCTCT